MKHWPRDLLIIGAFCVFIGFVSKSEFAFLPFLFLSLFVIGGAIASWRKSKSLEQLYTSAVNLSPRGSVIEAVQAAKRAEPDSHQYLRGLSKARAVRLKTVPRIISIAFPISWLFILFFGYDILRNRIAAGGRPISLGDLGAFLFFGSIWSIIGIYEIRCVRRDRQLLSKGDFSVATVIHQEIRRGGKQRSSEIHYEFKDAAGRRFHGNGTDESWSLYEDMDVLVFYDPKDPSTNVAYCAATFELKSISPKVE